jgi:hypothetical protein
VRDNPNGNGLLGRVLAGGGTPLPHSCPFSHLPSNLLLDTYPLDNPQCAMYTRSSNGKDTSIAHTRTTQCEHLNNIQDTIPNVLPSIRVFQNGHFHNLCPRCYEAVIAPTPDKPPLSISQDFVTRRNRFTRRPSDER